jgi:type IV pilus assembly protein PilX
MTPLPALTQPTGRTQRGVSLIFALITMVALSLAAVALIRSVDTGTLVLGNLGFKQDSLQGADDASRTAINWLSNNVADTRLHTDWADMAYYATLSNPTSDPLDVTGNGTGARTLIDWAGNACGGHTPCLSTRAISGMANGVTARYVILRLCNITGDPTAPGTGIQCARPLVNVANESGERGSLSYANSQRIGATTISQYFRILVRAQGGRDTATYTETLVHF